jgi:glycosyltransferase involved in cell wall biosynthesis
MPDPVPEVSIIVPVHNEASTLPDCIESLFQLNYPREKLELIFVDNNSSDQSSAILNSHQERIQVMSEKKRGPAAARNAGLRRCSRPIVAFTDADCIVDPDWLRNLIVPLQDPEAGIVGGMILSVPNGNAIERFAQLLYDQQDAIQVFRPPYVITMNWASRLSVLKEHNFFDERFIRCEDVELSYRISQSGYKIFFQPNAIVYHHNERTLTELFQKGFLHGLHSIKLHKQYSRYIQSFGHKRWHPHSYKLLFRDFRHALVTRDSNSGYSFLFNAGKKIGKLAGSARFLYVDL